MPQVYLDFSEQSILIRFQEDRMQLVPISEGKVGETFLTTYGKKIQVMQKSASSIKIVVMATRKEVDVHPTYQVVPIKNGAKRTEGETVPKKNEKKEAKKMKEKNGLRVEAVAEEDEELDEVESDEDEFLDADDDTDESEEPEEEDDSDEEPEEDEDAEEESDPEEDDDEEAEEDEEEEADSEEEDDEEEADEDSEESDDESKDDDDEAEEEDAEEDDSADEEEEDEEEEDAEEECEEDAEEDGELDLEADANADFASKEEVEEMKKRLDKLEKEVGELRKKSVDVVKKAAVKEAIGAKRGPKPKAKVPEKVRKEIEKSVKKGTKEVVKEKKVAKAKTGGEKPSRQIGLVVRLLQKKAQTRDTLAAAIKEAGMAKNKDDKAIKNYISVMLNKLQTQYVIKSPKRGVYRIVGEK